MKKILTIVAIYLLSISVNAQIEKGKILIITGTDLAMSFGKSRLVNDGSNSDEGKSKKISILFSIGGFTANNFALGFSVPIEYEYNEVDNNIEEQSSYGIAPFMRLYLSRTNINPYIQFDAGYVHVKNRPQNILKGVNLFNGFMMDGGIGFTTFVTENIAFDGQILYGYSKLYNSDDNDLQLKINAIGLNLGFTLIF